MMSTSYSVWGLGTTHCEKSFPVVSSLSPSSKHDGWWQWHSHPSRPSIMPHLDFDGSSISIIIIINVDASPSGMPMWHVTIGQCAHMCIPSGTLFKKNLGNFFFFFRWLQIIVWSYTCHAKMGQSCPTQLSFECWLVMWRKEHTREFEDINIYMGRHYQN